VQAFNATPLAGYLEKGRPQEDRLQGEMAEFLFADFLRKSGRNPVRNPGGFYPDFDIQDEHFTYEVKLDRKFYLTGNIYIEKKSLFNSKADYLVYLFQEPLLEPYFIWIVPASKARNFYRDHPEYALVGGDFKEPGILLPGKVFKSLFKPIGYALPQKLAA